MLAVFTHFWCIPIDLFSGQSIYLQSTATLIRMQVFLQFVFDMFQEVSLYTAQLLPIIYRQCRCNVDAPSFQLSFLLSAGGEELAFATAILKKLPQLQA